MLGNNHPNTAATFNNIAIVYKSQNDNRMALEWYQKSYLICLSRLGESHPDAKRTKENMETAYNRTGYEKPFEEWFNETFGALG
jgi:hypothetical protein